MTLIARRCKVKFFRNQFAFTSSTYSTTMLIDMSGAFTALETNVSQTGGNVHILHFELDYFCIFASCKKFFSGTLISLKRVESQCFDIAISYTRSLTY